MNLLQLYKMDRDILQSRIKETEANINFWFVMEGESVAESNYDLSIEIKYLESLKKMLETYETDRFERLVSNTECFES